MSVRLGPFEIQSQFATGGMGEIWKGIHVEQKIPVAIKVITGPNALVPEYMDEFRREVQAVARLNHPNVVRVFDYGRLPDEVNTLPGQLMPQAPYLVMEFSSRGSLADQDEPPNWRDLKSILMSTLGALAHAHARGVIHRDIKPGNVLLGSHHESPPRIILTDFGVAHATDRVTRTDAVELTARSTEEASGTPRYMAPEQFMGKWRDYGPATDLYAVGIMAYHLACGELPFKGGTFMLLAMAHINNPFPELKPEVELPDGFEDWIRRLTAKDPGDRFQSAANAAWALAQLDDSSILYGELSQFAGEPAYDDDDEWEDSTDMLPTRVDFAPPEAIRVFQMSRSVAEEKYADVPPLPVTWREAEPPKAEISLVGSGLGLFGLRSIPLVGRERQRTRLWDVFKDVHSEQRHRAVVIRGLAGTGKSGLAEWFTNLVDEIGAATTFEATHSANPGMMHGLGWMMNSHFRCAGLNIDDLHERLEGVLERFEMADEATILGMAEIMRTDMRDTSATTSAILRFTQAEQRYKVIRDVIDRTTPERPVVTWLDDVHWESDSIDFVRWSLDYPGEDDHPRMFVLTVRDEAVRDRAEVEHALDLLTGRDDVTTVDVPPLSRTETASLVQEHLYLPNELADDVARRAGGSPLFAIQLVEDWVKREVLEVEGGSFVVRRGETAELPSDAESLWASRLDHFLYRVASIDSDGTHREPVTRDDAQSALELAATLGQDINIDEWQAVCDMAELPVDQTFLDELVRLRLATRSDTGFSLINAQLVDLLVEQARDGDRWVDHNMRCARMLADRYGNEHPGLAQRVGRHFVDAKAHRLAVTCLEEAYRRAHGTAEQREISEINELLERCYRSMEIDDGDIRWAELWVRRSVPKIHSADPEVFDDGIELLERAAAIARENERDPILAGILRAQAWAAIHGADVESGLDKAREALELSSGRGSLEASCHRTLGHLLLLNDQVDEAIGHLEQAVELAPDSVHAVWARQQLASAAVLRGRLQDAEELLEVAMEGARAEGVVMAEAQIQETWGFVAERRGDFREAEERHREAMRLRGAVSSDSTLHAKSREYVARAVLAQGRHSEARDMLLPLAARLDAGAKGYFTHLDDALLVTAAADGDWTEWEQRFDDAFDFSEFPPTTVHTRALATAADLARDAGYYSLARPAYERLVELLDEHGLDPTLARDAQREREAIAERDDLLDATTREESLDDLEDSGHFGPPNTEQHDEFSDEQSAPHLDADDLAEDSDPIEEPDFTGRVQVLSLPVDPAEDFGQLGFEESDAAPPADEEFESESFNMFRVADLKAAVFGDGPPEVPSDAEETNEMAAPDIRRKPRSEQRAAADPGIEDDIERDFAELDELSLSTGSRPPITEDDVDPE